MVVELVPHNPRWDHDFTQEAVAIRHALGDNMEAIHHVGSTAVPGMLAKPVIDVLCVVTSLAAVDAAVPRIQALGYTAKGEYGLAGRHYFQKKDAHGVRSHHVHVYGTGADPIERHLAFRDFLRAHPAAAARYSAVKKMALTSLPLTRQAYQDWKAPFILATLAEAMRWYRLQQDQ
ncbi:GrpB family protein [Hymenobacter sp. IS2118]|uniref:GrpB family protein n=1 Tax=Hymenobacter sp. IS2118 TaxID=1505605 RepID=UPI0005554DD5|nr:GrpB family protein [Hymenobacter sp. IS2118]